MEGGQNPCFMGDVIVERHLVSLFFSFVYFKKEKVEILDKTSEKTPVPKWQFFTKC